jgi:RHS repeat-associated protein
MTWFSVYGDGACVVAIQDGSSYKYTGQYNDSYINLYWYNSRWYDPSLGRFNQPDTMIPGTENSQSWDRFLYSLNNPMNFIDPSGHCAETPDDDDIACWKLAQEIADKYDELAYDELILWNEAQLAKLLESYQERGVLPPPKTISDVAEEIEYIDLAIDVLEYPWKIIDGDLPFSWGFLIDGGIQFLRDFNRDDLSPLQRTGRIIIVGVEGVGVQFVSAAVGSGVGLITALVVTEIGQPYLTLYSYPAGFSVGYIATNLAVSEALRAYP